MIDRIAHRPCAVDRGLQFTRIDSTPLAFLQRVRMAPQVPDAGRKLSLCFGQQIFQIRGPPVFFGLVRSAIGDMRIGRDWPFRITDPAPFHIVHANCPASCPVRTSREMKKAASGHPGRLPISPSM